ncbi:hypothetical protein BH11MYX1_BH11MYX1_07420 [soil metagenome]
MQLRLSQGAHVALGLQSGQPSAEDVRAAFLQLTKQFHPARFGRLSTETQKLSTEVFLGIKSAHESLLRHVGGPIRGGARTNQSVGIRALTNEDATRPLPIQTRAVGTQQPAISRTMTPTRHGVGHTGSPTFGTPRPSGSGPQPAVSPIPSTPSRGAPRRGTPPSTRPSTPNLAPPPPAASDPVTHRGTGEWSPSSRTTPAFDERAELVQVLDALAAKSWAQAKMLLNSLAARVPASKQYRALLAYTRGREAQTAGRGEDAVMEFQRALQFDPDLQQAKSAMAELLRRR